MERSNWWLSPVWEYQTPFDDHFNVELLKEVYAIGKVIATGGTNGKLSLWDYNTPCLTALRSYIMDKAYESVRGDIAEVSELNLRIDSVMGWINVKGPGESIEAHAHNDCSLTATYYIQVPPNSGDIVLLDHSSIVAPDGSFINDSVSQVKHYHITPTAGKLVIFPGYVLHEVQVNKSNNLRISISTDMQQIVDKDAPNALVIKSWCDNMLRLKHVCETS
jgi:uncharacterized protein (TIGR02466 family)